MWWQDIVETAKQWSSTIIIAAVGLTVVVLVHRILWRRHNRPDSENGLIGPMTTLTLVSIVTVATIMSLPIGDAARGQLLSLLGLLVAAAIALSSTTFLGNALAGIMLRAIRGFALGDYIRVEEYAGRVSDRGILHTEIQTEDRDLTTIPNLFLVTHPVTVLRSSGTVISATVSLGYEINSHKVEELLIEAGKLAGLTDTFVQVDELGDYSITYRAAGILTKVNHLLTARSGLRKAILDTLHAADIEIVSPTFMNQRVVAPDASFIPSKRKRPAERVDHVQPEDVIFDKANLAETKAKLIEQIKVQESLVKGLASAREISTLEAEGEAIDYKLKDARERLQTMLAVLEGVDKESEKV